MKRPLIFLATAAVALAFGACNKHSWDEEVDGQIPTKKIFEPHGDHGHDADHGKGGDGGHESEAAGEHGDKAGKHP